MSLTVKQRGDSVATFRWVDVHLMEMLAAWVPTTPEMEAKLVFGAHIWDLAQHADHFGKRTYELRRPLQDSMQPSEAYRGFLDGVAATTETTKRIAAFYDVVLPGVARRLEDYAGRVDHLLDAPTLRIVERVSGDITRMRADGGRLREEVPELAGFDARWLEDLRAREGAVGDFVVYRPARDPAASAR